MDHEYYKERVSAYVDGALPPYEQMAIEEHVPQCVECGALLEKLRKLEAMVEDKSRLGKSDYWEQQAQKIEARLGLAQTEVTRIGPARSWRGLGWKLTAAAASIVVVGVIGFYSWESIREQTDRPPVQMAPSLPPAPVIAPQKVQPEQEKADEAKKSIEAKNGEGPSKGQITDTQNYKAIAPGGRRTVGTTGVKYQTDGLVRISNEKAKSAPTPVRSAQISESSKSDISLKTIDVPAEPAVHAESLAQAEAQSDIKLTAIAPPAATVAAESRVYVDTVAQQAPVVKGLAYWQGIRDSLSGNLSAIQMIGKSIVNVRGGRPSSLAAGLVQKKDSTNGHSLLLEAYFWIAQLSKDSSETRTATEYLQKVSGDTKSPYQALARAYLDSLGIK